MVGGTQWLMMMVNIIARYGSWFKIYEFYAFNSLHFVDVTNKGCGVYGLPQ